jgi:hypothetical protein
MIIKPSNPFSQPGTSRRAAAALLLSVALALTCASPSQARTGFGGATLDGFERTVPAGIFRFLMRIYASVGGVLDPNGNQ